MVRRYGLSLLELEDDGDDLAVADVLDGVRPWFVLHDHPVGDVELDHLVTVICSSYTPGILVASTAINPPETHVPLVAVTRAIATAAPAAPSRFFLTTNPALLNTSPARSAPTVDAKSNTGN